MMLDIAILA